MGISGLGAETPVYGGSHRKVQNYFLGICDSPGPAQNPKSWNSRKCISKSEKCHLQVGPPSSLTAFTNAPNHKFWTNFGFGAFVNAVRGKRARNQKPSFPRILTLVSDRRIRKSTPMIANGDSQQPQTHPESQG